MDRDLQQLRTKVNSTDPFMTGHQILIPNVTRIEIPEWTQTDLGVQKVLLTAFPKLDTDSRQRLRAGRWALLIYYYFRLRLTRSQIADELGIPENTVKCTIRGILRVAAGFQFGGSKTPRKRKRVDPAKPVSAPLQNTL